MRDLFATPVRDTDSFVDLGQPALDALLRVDGVVGVALDLDGADGEPVAALVNEYLDPERVLRYLVSGFRTDPVRAAAHATHAAVLGADLLGPRALRTLAAEYGCQDALCRHLLVAPVFQIGTLRAVVLRDPPAGARDLIGALGAYLAIRLATLGLPAAPRQAALTARQREVAALVARGYTNDAIASALAISGNAVKKHVATMLEALGAANRAELAALAGRPVAIDPLIDARLAPGYRIIRRPGPRPRSRR